MKWVTFVCLAIAVSTFSSFNLHSKQTTEDISADIGLLYGANTVYVNLYRSGTNAGDGCVTFKVDIWFNSETNIQTFYFSMANQETYKLDVVQGPNPTGFAGVSGSPYDIQYNCY